MRTSLRILFGAIIVVLLFFVLGKINFPEVYQIFRSISPKFFLLAFASYSLAIVIFSLRSMISLRKIILKHDFWFFLKTALAGSFINVITPGSNVGGEPIRAYFLGEKYNKPKTQIFGAVLADRILHGAASLFFTVASLLFILTYIPVSEELEIIFQTALFFIIAFLAIVFLLNMKKTRFNLSNLLKKIRVLVPIKKSSKIHHIGQTFGNFTRSFKRTIFNKKTLFFGLLFSFAFWILNYLSSYFLFLSLDVKISFFLVITVVSLVTFAENFSPIPGGIGLSEGFMIFFYSVIGVEPSAAIIVTLLSRMIIYFYSLVLGGINLFYLEKSLG